MNQPGSVRRVVVVTGAAAGIGKAIADRFLEDNTVVYGVDVDAGALDSISLGRETSQGGRFVPLVADVATESDVLQAINRVTSESSRIDVLVNNAGVNLDKRLAQIDTSEWERVMQINLRGAYLFCRSVWPHLLRQNSGVIINVSSIMGRTGGAGAPAYCASKAALTMLSRCLARDGAPHGIRVNTVSPGFIDTPNLDRAMAAHPDPLVKKQQLADSQPMRRLGTGGDVAHGVHFLSSEAASFISGVDLVIDGALTAVQLD